MLVPLHGLRIDRAAREMQTVRQVLIVRNSFVMAHVETAVVTKYARTYIVLFVVHQFCDPCLIREELTRKARAVNSAPRDRFRSRFGIEPSCADNGDVDKFLYMFNVGKIAVFGHIYRGMSPVPRIVCAVVAVQTVVTRVLQIFCRLFGLFHIAPDFRIVFSRKSALTEAFRL